MTKHDVLCLYEAKDIAMDILKHMVDLASTRGYVTVNQYLEMSGIDECMKGGNEWGWYAKTIMDTVGIKTRCGWILDLGHPRLITEKLKDGRYSWLSEEPPNTDFWFIYEDYREPNTILDRMKNLAEIYGYVTIDDFEKISDMKSKYTTPNRFGWSSEMLSSATIRKVYCGYLLKLCTPVVISTLEDIPNGQTDENVHPHRSGKYPFSYGQNMYNGILIGYAEKSIQNYIENGNLDNLKAARDILTTAIVKLEDEESEEK